MPSEDRSREAFELLAPAREPFRAAVIAAADEVRTFLATQRVRGDGQMPGLDLGLFGAGRIAADRFSALFAGATVLDEEALERVEHSHAALAELVERGGALFSRDVAAGDDLAAVVRGALADAGRAFAAAGVVARIRAGGAPGADGDAPFPFERWNRAERQVAPPLVVGVDGADLRVDALAELLDGRQKLVLVVRGECPPAPLARLVTPGVYVAQLGGPQELKALVDFDGPGVAALVPEGAALFTHDPTLAPPLSASRLPQDAPRKPVGRASTFRQAEDLAQLRRLLEGQAGVPAAASGTEPGAEPVTTADRLAAWLLRQADLDAAS